MFLSIASFLLAPSSTICRLSEGIIAEKPISESTRESHGAIIIELSLKYLKNLCYGKEFLPHFGHFTMFRERSSGVRTPHFVREGPVFKSIISGGPSQDFHEIHSFIDVIWLKSNCPLSFHRN